MNELLYPDLHPAEERAQLTLEDMAVDRFLHPPLSWDRYKESGRVKLFKAGTRISAPTLDDAYRLLSLVEGKSEEPK